MQEKLAIKSNAAELLDRQLALRAKKEQYGYIVLASATDPYLHFEEKEKLTRSLLEVISKHRFPVHMITKSNGIQRDFDLLHEINEKAMLPKDLEAKGAPGVIISFSFSTLNEKVAQIFEPGAPLPAIRLNALKTCLDYGFHSGVSLMPLLPYVSDTGENLKLYFQTFSEMGVKFLLPAGITLFGDAKSDSKTLVIRAISKYYPHLKMKYEKLFSQGSELPSYYRNAFHRKMLEMATEYNISLKILS